MLELLYRVELVVTRCGLGSWAEPCADGFCHHSWCVAHGEVVALRNLDLFEVVESLGPLRLETEVVVAFAEHRHGRQ